MNNKLIKRIVIGASIFGVVGLVKGLIGKLKSSNEDAVCIDWYKEYEKKAEDDYLRSGFVTVDTNRRMIIDGNTGEILEDFNIYSDPEKTMSIYMKALWTANS